MNKTLKSYFYWTYPRGSFHYDVMVTLILLFIFVTPWVWDFGEKPSRVAGPQHPIQVVGSGHGMIVSLHASDVTIPEGADVKETRKLLRKAIEPVTGDAVSVDHWETTTDHDGQLVWKIWAHR
ncbi:MAG TPA: hypothetical protein VG844_13210 [Terracidiphilus sp.]|jgi:hypothetical protein|nr:hypothetical protein [Terracidiphilus sp.]